jgi:hypothetical protein
MTITAKKRHSGSQRFHIRHVRRPTKAFSRRRIGIVARSDREQARSGRESTCHSLPQSGHDLVSERTREMVPRTVCLESYRVLSLRVASVGAETSGIWIRLVTSCPSLGNLTGADDHGLPRSNGIERIFLMARAFVSLTWRCLRRQRGPKPSPRIIFFRRSETAFSGV